MTELDPLMVRRAQTGDRSAQETFVRRYAGPLHSLIRRSGVTGDADDLAHDLMSRLIVALPRFQSGGSATLTTWVFTIAQRFIIDASRKRHLTLVPLASGSSVADPRPDAIAQLERHELARRLEAALATLPLDQRRTFVLAQVHQRPLQEIAEAESVPLGTVKSRIHRARAALDVAGDGPALVFAYKANRTALTRDVLAGSNVALRLAEPGKILVHVSAPGTYRVLTAPAGTPATFPAMWAGQQFTGSEVELDRPAGDYVMSLSGDGDDRPVAQLPVHVETGREVNVTAELQRGNALLRGRVLDATTRKSLKHYRVALPNADTSMEQDYTADSDEFVFRGRAAGEHHVLIVLDGYKPLMVRAVLEAKKTTDLGGLVLEPL